MNTHTTLTHKDRVWDQPPRKKERKKFNVAGLTNESPQGLVNTSFIVDRHALPLFCGQQKMDSVNLCIIYDIRHTCRLLLLCYTKCKKWLVCCVIVDEYVNENRATIFTLFLYEIFSFHVIPLSGLTFRTTRCYGNGSRRATLPVTEAGAPRSLLASESKCNRPKHTEI